MEVSPRTPRRGVGLPWPRAMVLGHLLTTCVSRGRMEWGAPFIHAADGPRLLPTDTALKGGLRLARELGLCLQPARWSVSSRPGAAPAMT